MSKHSQKKNPPTLSEQIRQAVDNCGVTRYRIAKDTGISEPALSHFMSGKSGLSMRALDKLSTYLGLVVSCKPLKKR
jgi:transcriptional regulator with XRE-family HTH domain